MTDVQKAAMLLAQSDLSLVLCKNEELITASKTGISPLVELVESGAELSGYSAADKIVGRAAALLFVLSGVRTLHAQVLSKGAEDILQKHGIEYTYDRLCDHIINRDGNAPCPMEQATAGIDDPAAALQAVKQKLSQLKKG